MSSGERFSRRALFRKSLRGRSGSEKEPAAAPNTPEPMEPLAEEVPDCRPPIETTPEQIAIRIAAEPACQALLTRLLDYCLTPRTESDIYCWMRPFPEMRIGLYAPETLLRWMVETGAIRHQAESGDPGLWETTPEGRRVLSDGDAAGRLEKLRAEESEKWDIYREVLRHCLHPRSRLEIEALLAEAVSVSDGALPSYYLDRLELSGGIEWTGKWATTAAGKRALESLEG